MTKGLGTVLAKILAGLMKGQLRSARRDPSAAWEMWSVIFQFLFVLVIIAIAVAIVAAIVIAISRKYETHQLSSLTNSHAIEEHKKINFWLHFYLTVIWCLGLLALLGSTGDSGADESGGGGFFNFLIIVAILAAWLTAFYQITLRLWKVIPQDIARCTPEKAAGYSLIPFFNFYWWFIAFRGLAEDINKTASRYGSAVLISMNFATAVCIVWVCDIGLDMLASKFYKSLGILPALVVFGLTTAFFIQLRNAVTTLLILKTNPSGTSAPPPNQTAPPRMPAVPFKEYLEYWRSKLSGLFKFERNNYAIDRRFLGFLLLSGLIFCFVGGYAALRSTSVTAASEDAFIFISIGVITIITAVIRLRGISISGTKKKWLKIMCTVIMVPLLLGVMNYWLYLPTALHVAADKGDLAAVKRLVSERNVNAKTWSGYTPLYFALKHADVVKFLVSQRADVNARFNYGNSLLHKAILWSPSPEIIEFLVSHGANVHAQNDFGYTPLHNVRSYRGNDDDKKIVDILVSHGADINAADDILMTTLLHWAARGGNVDFVRFLVQRGADVHAKNYAGKTPLDCAREENNTEVVAYLSRL